MSGYTLQGGDGKWQGVGDDPTAMGCILIIANAGGSRYCLGTIDVSVPEVSGGSPLHFVGAILNDVKFGEQVDPFVRNVHAQGIDVRVTEDHFPLQEMRRSGLLLQDIDVDVYYHIEGRNMDLSQGIHLLRGKLSEPSYNEKARTVSFRVEDRRLEGERPFPPVVASQDLIAGLLAEDAGKAYPVVIGSVKKLPVLDISAGAFDDFLVMLDRHNEWPTPAVVNAIYDEDASGPPTEAAEAQATDSDGNPYVHVTSAAGTTSRDITVDVDGHTPATPAEAIRYLLTFFGRGADVFDMPSLDKLDVKMPGVTMSMAFNKRERGGVLGIIRNRISSLLPFTLLQRGDKYSFEPLIWDRDVTKHLRSDVNIVRTVGGPAETRRSDVFNSFTVNYGRSHFRGEHTGTVTRDWTSDKACETSRLRYGQHLMPDVDAGDLDDAVSARWLMNWLIETFSKMRVFVSYECTMDVVDVQLWDTVSVADVYEGWADNRRGPPLFKVIGIGRRTGPTITLDLVSIDDYADVYDVNRPAAEARTQAPLPATTISDHATLPTDLVLHYSCEDAGGHGNPVVDDTVNGYDGTCVGAVGSDPGGIIDSCLDLENGPYFTLPDIRSEFTDEASINVWLKKDGQLTVQDGLWYISSYAVVPDQYPDNAGANPYYINAFRSIQGPTIAYDPGFDLTEWHMLTVTTEPGADGYKVYQNAVEISSSTGEAAISMHASTWWLGRNIGGRAFDGLWDQCAIWSKALTPSEVSDLYNSGVGLPFS